MAQEKISVAAKSSQKQISDKQRTRITENFRAAKALLARKRPSQPVTSFGHHGIPHKKLSAMGTSETALNAPCSSGSRNMNMINLRGSLLYNKLPRFPLAEIQANRMESRPVYKSDSVNLQNVKFSITYDENQNYPPSFAASHMDSEPSTTSKLEMAESKEMAKVSVSPESNPDFLEREINTSSMEAPMSNSCTFSSEAPSESASSRSCAALIDIADDDFDDAILAEIDALCAKRPVLNQENVSTGLLNIPRDNLQEMPVLNSNVVSPDVVDWPRLEQSEADYIEEFLGTKINHVETAHGFPSSHVENFKLENLEEVLPSDAVSLATPPKQDLALVELKTEREDACILQLDKLKAHAEANIQAVCDTGSSMINPSETTHRDLLAHSSNASDSFPNGSTASSDLSLSTSDTLPPYLQSLNDTQREAATSDISKPLMILAGPGSGKTSTMVARLLTLLKEGIHSTNILAMTFTTAAASEMRERVGAVVGKAVAKGLNICTFHSFCLNLCRSHAEKLGRTSEFLIYGHGQQRRAIIEAVRLTTIENQADNDAKNNDQGARVDVKVNVDLCKEKSKKWQQFVTQAKAAGKTPADYAKMGNEMGAAILRHYNATLASCNALDYHDFISCAVKLLSNDSEVLEECQKSWTAILVDEFQDTSSMQYLLLRLLSSHNRITVVGDDDQSIFSFNGADISGFDSFRKDYPCHKEVRLHQNYRSTRCIVEAASSMIQNNVNRCQLKHAFTNNVSGDKIMIRECRNEDAQCAFVVDKILMNASENSIGERLFSSVAILYRRQVTGKLFQSVLRARKIPFNVHGVAFYRKKVIKVVISMLQSTLPICGDLAYRRVFKALYLGEKAEQKRVIEYVEKVAQSLKCRFLDAARDIFTAKISGTFNRRQLAQGRKVLFIMDRIYKLVRKERSLSAVVTSIVNFLPQKFLFEKRAVVDEDSGKLLNEDQDPRSVLEYLLDDVSDFLSNYFNSFDIDGKALDATDQEGCLKVLKTFLDYLSAREMENFRCRRENNQNSVTLTTMHQSKGLEWDTVFLVKANDSEIPLLHEAMGSAKNGASSLEEERRLFYVAMTRARKKLYILHVVVDSNWQLLYPSRFLKELPSHLVDTQDVSTSSWIGLETGKEAMKCVDKEALDRQVGIPQKDYAAPFAATEPKGGGFNQSSSLNIAEGKDLEPSMLSGESIIGNAFLKGFSVEARSTVAVLFHTWAKKRAFQDPKRLLDKIGFVVDERMRSKTSKNKDVLRALKSCLKCDEAFQYAKHVLRWEQMPSDERSLLLAERQEHFQKEGYERSMDSAAATSKQIVYLQNLGCTINPTSRLHASRLIEQYKSL